ncbi:MAG: Mrp/NBP35 family ATP-binding protein [Catalinimonas sp.]
MNITPEAVRHALSHVQEPDLKRDLITLDMVKDITVDGTDVRFTVVLTTPACPLKELIRRDCEAAIHEHVSPDCRVFVDMTAQVTTTRNQAPVLPDVRNVICVASGKGGVGKSTVAANLALALAQSGARVGLLDADISGPSIPLMFGAEDARPGVVQEDGRNQIIPVERLGIKLLSIGFLAPAESAVVWRGPMMSSALKQFLTDGRWGALDYLIIDMPPGTSDVHLTLVQTVPVTGAVLVTTPQKVALADAVKGLAMFRQKQINVPVLGVVENMAYFTPAELPDNKYYLFGQGGGRAFAERYEVPFLGEVPIVQSIREGGDNGRPAVMERGAAAEAFQEVAAAVAQRVAIRNATFDQTVPVEIKL